MINIGTVVNLIPVAGNALPFISAGGSNLITMLAGVGILMGIARNSKLSSTVQKGVLVAMLLICAGGTGGGVYPSPVNPTGTH